MSRIESEQTADDVPPFQLPAAARVRPHDRMASDARADDVLEARRRIHATHVHPGHGDPAAS